MIAGLTDILNTSSDQVQAEDSRNDLGRDSFLTLFIAQFPRADSGDGLFVGTPGPPEPCGKPGIHGPIGAVQQS